MNRVKSAFAPPRKGETFELRAGLVSQYAYERKEAIQKTIMAMTLGKDVSQLFPDVLKNIATSDLDQKKLVYLYLMYVPPMPSYVDMLTSLGTMPNHIQICVFWLSTLSCRTPKTQLHSFERWLSGRWAASEWTK